MGYFAEMIEGPRTKIEKFNDQSWMTQIGWLGHTGTFYPWPGHPTKEQEPGGYMPVYIQDGD